MSTESVSNSIVRRRRSIQETAREGQPIDKSRYLKTLDCDLRELNRSYSSCLQYKSMHSQTHGSCDSELVRRASMYRSSEEIRRMRKLRDGRRTVEKDENFLMFKIVNRLPRNGASTENQLKKFPPLVSSSANSKPTGDTVKPSTKSSAGFLDLSFRDLPDKPLCAKDSSSDSMSQMCSLVDDSSAICIQAVDTNICRRKAVKELLKPGSLKEESSLKNLPKCLSESAKVSHAVSQMEHGSAECHGSKTLFSPLKKILHPIMKSKSVRYSSFMRIGNTVPKPANMRNGVPRNSSINEVSVMEQNMQHHTCLKEEESLTATISLSHLHGILRFEVDKGDPLFKFSFEYPEDVLAAKMWKTDSVSNWIYTFHRPEHTINTDRGAKCEHTESLPLVGQMQVSCYLCPGVVENGFLDNSIVTECVLYDLARERKDLAIEERSKCSSDSIGKPFERKHTVEHSGPVRNQFRISNSSASTSYPWLPKNLHPRLEIAAIEIKTPFKGKSWRDHEEFREENQSLSKHPTVDLLKTSRSNLNDAIVRVVTPSGIHGLPNGVEGGPTSLLDRWRCGGGCDCGGWDTACPIIMLNNHSCDDSEDHSARKNQKPILLFEQGRKENVPAVSIMAGGEGQYSVDFHTSFSSLQAFSIGIAILHNANVSSALIQEKSRHRLHSNSLKLLFEEEARHLIEQRKAKEGVEQVPSLFVNRPFSPMGRV
ncbi:uncharacterized protein LOC141832428 [Curcuma longa]|uniref:uncharacterized protein LOC141832428 n=1 Tax=Curcuma longa TaxID=136217 RepID=UPI003D9F35D6